MAEVERSETREEEVKDLLSKAAGAGILAATGHPIGVVLGAIETGLIIRKQVDKFKNKKKSSEEPTIQDPDTIFRR